MGELAPIHGARPPFVAGTFFDLGPLGYRTDEFSLSGLATAYGRRSRTVGPVARAPFVTRLLVHRPVDPAAFSGTVWVEWLNVSGGLDAAPAWIFAHTELMRAGAAWVGVSAQALGVAGGTSPLGMAGDGLVGTDPERYASLEHPGDRFSYDIYAQAAEAVRAEATALLGELAVERVLAVGESQSAFRLTTMVNDLDALRPVVDGYLVHARADNAAPLHDEEPAVIRQGEPAPFTGDLRVPVLCVEAETDLVNLGYQRARQAEGERLVVWEMAGTSHADMYTFAAGFVDTGHLPIAALAPHWRPVRELFGTALDLPVNAGPQHYVVNAAARHLDRWVRTGQRPPSADPLATDEGGFVTDERGNVRAGVRTPHVDVPTAVLSGLGNGGHPIVFLCGSTLPFDPATVRSLYGSHAGYLQQVAAATDAAVTAGFVLAEDAVELRAIAAYNSPLGGGGDS